MQKITPFLWFDNQAGEAMQLYTSTFEASKVSSQTRWKPEVPAAPAEVMMGTFQLAGQQFMALNGGPLFPFTQAISFFVTCRSADELERLWGPLAKGGKERMALQEYPFSRRYGWTSDRYGVNWQLNLAGSELKISPCLMYCGQQAGKAEEAIHFYTSLFDESAVQLLARYEPGQGGMEGKLSHAEFTLAGQTFMAMDGYMERPALFNESISFFVSCGNQAEVDAFWERLSAGGEKSQCGWLKDRYGVSWQVVPTILGELMNDRDPEKVKRVNQALIKMNKIEIEKLEAAYQGK